MLWSAMVGAAALGAAWMSAPGVVSSPIVPTPTTVVGRSSEVASSSVVQGAPVTRRTRCVRPTGSGAGSWLDLEPLTGLGTVTAWVCLRLPGAMAVGSYRGELTWDSTVARVLDVASPPGGSRVANRHERGRVRFAGAAPSGFTDGEVLRVRLHTVRRGVPVRLVLRWKEVNAVDGHSLTSVLRVDSVAPFRSDTRRVDAAQTVRTNRCTPGEVRLISLAPDTVDLSSGDRGEVVATGCGFAGLNAVEVGPATVREVRSTGNGSRLAFVVPMELPASGEAPPMAMPRGRVPVRVVTPRGASNSLPLVLR